MPFLFSKRFLSAALAAVLTASSALAQQVRLSTVVLDPGHGGHDSGAISLDGRLKEKDVVLDVALRLEKRINGEYPDVKVICTRRTDEFIPLDKRADIANKNKADLFISVHVNSVPKTSKAPSGCETFVMGMHKNAANMEVCKRENSVILMEDDYSTKYQGFDPSDTESYIFFNLMQNAYFEQSLIFADLCQKELRKGPITNDRGIKQGGLLVLWRTTMPAVLVELGFITNASDRATLSSPQKREQLAGDLFGAFVKFKEQYESAGDGTETDQRPEAEAAAKEESPAQSAAGSTEAQPATGSAVAQPAAADGAAAESAAAPAAESGDAGTYYTVQVFALSKKLESGAPQFKGHKDVHSFKVGAVYKYSVGTFVSEAEAAKASAEMKSDFPGCFVVKIDNFEIKKN